MKRSYTYILLALLGLGSAGCNYNFPDPAIPATMTTGTADFSNYVAVGNSITAGFMNGTLYREGQQVAYPAILHRQVFLFNQRITPFVQAEVPSSTGINSDNPTLGRLTNISLCVQENFAPAPVPADVAPQVYFAPYAFKAANRNFSVPGATIGDAMAPGLGSPRTGLGNVTDFRSNPYYIRMASAPGTSTLIGDAVAANPTFFTLWLGSNDALSYATNGGVLTGNGGRLTPPSDFEAQYAAALLALRSRGANGAVATIPDITSIPHFTFIGSSAPRFNLTATQAAQLNFAYQAQGYTANQPLFNEGSNYFLIETHTGAVRQFNPATDFLVLGLSSKSDSLGQGPIVRCGQTVGQRRGMGVISSVETVNIGGTPVPKAYPIPNRFVLDAYEAGLVRQAIGQYNDAIRRVVGRLANNNVAIVDIDAVFRNGITNGIRNPAGKNTVYLDMGPSGAFSLDGIHPTGKGQAIIANEFIRAINAKFAGNIPLVDLSLFPGNQYPR